jgi:hypothetical protein
VALRPQVPTPGLGPMTYFTPELTAGSMNTVHPTASRKEATTVYRVPKNDSHNKQTINSAAVVCIPFNVVICSVHFLTDIHKS